MVTDDKANPDGEADRQPTMTPEEFREARRELGLSTVQMGVLLGYDGVNIRSQVLKMEQGGTDGRAIRPVHVRLVRAYLAGYRPDDWPAELREE